MSYTVMKSDEAKALAEDTLKQICRARRQRYRKEIQKHRKGFFRKRTVKEAVDWVKSERHWELHYKLLYWKSEDVAKRIIALAKHSADGVIHISGRDLSHIK